MVQNNDRALCSSIGDNMETSPTSYNSNDKEANSPICRVCQCTESDRRGDAALGFLDINPPSSNVPQSTEERNSTCEAAPEIVDNYTAPANNCQSESGFIEFISPEGEIFICSADVEAGPYQHLDTLIDLGCSCKSDLSLAHYACALKWFISHGSTICEICGSLAKNIQPADFKKIMASLKDYEALKERTAIGELNPVHVTTNSCVDPDALAAIRRQRLSEISLWFNPQSSNSVRTVISQGVTDQSTNITTEAAGVLENTTTKWAAESTGILVATGLLTVTLAWLIAPRVGKRTARSGLHILLGDCAIKNQVRTSKILGDLICLLVSCFWNLGFSNARCTQCMTCLVVVRKDFASLMSVAFVEIVLSRIKYRPARYWVILFVFWFLVFGIWASRTHGAQNA